MKIHNLRKLLKIRTKAREENSWDSQIYELTKRISFNIQGWVLQMDKTSFYREEARLRSITDKKKWVNFANQELTSLSMIINDNSLKSESAHG